MARPFGPYIKGRKYKDPLEHEKHIGFLRSRSQANYRKEGWTLTIEEFMEMWRDDLWLCRGRSPEDLVMIRVDINNSWSYENCVIVSRYQQLCRNKSMRKHQGYKDLKI
jgi:hypothetical protein